MMKRLLNLIRAQSASDDADAVLITVVLALPLLITLLGWSVDFSKNFTVRSDLDSIAQEATTTSIKYQDGVGNVDCVNTS